MTVSDFYKSIFGCKVYKISLNSSCTCPNRDGTKGFGGCIFCSEVGSGDFAPSKNLSIVEQIKNAKLKVQKKALGRSGKNEHKYIAYFQNFTSTYGDEELLKQKFLESLSDSEVLGLAVATRADCLSDSMISFFAELSKRFFVQIELGLQTSDETTGIFINRCFSNLDYINTVKKIQEASQKIHIVTHLIFGLPDENRQTMLNSVRFVCKFNASAKASFDSKNAESFINYFGIKITCLYVVQNTKLAELYLKGECSVLEKETYFSLVKDALKILPSSCVIHRLTGDPPKKTVIAPLWACDKKRVLNELRAMTKV